MNGRGRKNDKRTLTRPVGAHRLLFLFPQPAGPLDNAPRHYVNCGVREEGKGVGGKWMWVICAFMTQSLSEPLLAVRALTRSFLPLDNGFDKSLSVGG